MAGPGQGKGEGPGSQLAWPEKREEWWGLLGLDRRWGVHRIRRSTGVGGVVEAEPAGLQTMVRGQCQLTAGKK